MKHGSTLLLRAAVLVSALVVATLCFVVIPAVFTGWAEEYPNAAGWEYPISIALATSGIGFFMATYQTLKLLHYIDKNSAFSQQSVNALRAIKYCGLLISTLYAGGLPLVYYMAQQEDAPGLVVLGMTITFAAFVVAVFAAVLERLLRSAIALKSENDLTV